MTFYYWCGMNARTFFLLCVFFLKQWINGSAYYLSVKSSFNIENPVAQKHSNCLRIELGTTKHTYGLLTYLWKKKQKTKTLKIMIYQLMSPKHCSTIQTAIIVIKWPIYFHSLYCTFSPHLEYAKWVFAQSSLFFPQIPWNINEGFRGMSDGHHCKH